MNRIAPKNPRLRLVPELYEHLRQQVLRRDGWRCQSCGTMLNLEVHHKELRSRSGDGWRMRMQSSWQKRSSSWIPCRSMRCQVRGPGGGAHSPCPAALLHLAAAGAHRRHVAAPSHRVHYPEVRAEAAFRATPVWCGEEVASPGVSWSLSASSLRILRPRSAGVKGF